MKKTPKSALLIFVIFLVSCSSCKDFDWDPQPWSGDPTKQQIVKFDGVTMKCNQPAFKEMTCFDADNIAALKTAIDEVKMSTSSRDKVNILFSRMKP